MRSFKEQVHSKFKIFAGDLAPDKTIGGLADEVAKFVKKKKVAPKSIGVEYVESLKRLVVTLGYRDDEKPYPVKLTCVSLGKVTDLTQGDGLKKVEKAMAKASKKVANVICHELYITEDKEFLMILMSHGA